MYSCPLDKGSHLFPAHRSAANPTDQAVVGEGRYDYLLDSHIGHFGTSGTFVQANRS